ncbi:hypothetical protein BGW37DRAFT_559554 [Umbelopsis sp. PMI_123]|nr:hypothetical protein BGW37DRAFT_559554 [Umbelopsis sp. PMI_123]
MLPSGENSIENSNMESHDKVKIIENITIAVQNIRTASPVVTDSSHAIDIVESIRNKLLLLLQTNDRASVSSKGKNGHKEPDNIRYAAGLLVVLANMDEYTDSMEDILVYTAYKECRIVTDLDLNQAESNYLQQFGKRWSSRIAEATSILSESRPAMSDDVYEKLLALGSYNEILSKKILGRESHLLKRKDFSIGMTDDQRITTGIQPGDGWRISLLYLLAVSRKYPDNIAATTARRSGGNAADAGCGISFHIESLVSEALTVNDQTSSFQDTVRLRKFVSVMYVDNSWHFEDFETVTEHSMDQLFDLVVTNHTIN